MTARAKATVRIVEDADRIKYVSFHLKDLTKMGLAEQNDRALGRRVRKIIIGVTSGESGHDPLADRALHEALERMAHGRKGADARWRRNDLAERPVCPSITRGMPTETKTEKRKILKPNPKKGADSVSDSVSGNGSFLESEQPEEGKDAVFAHPEPWKLAAAFCGQGGDKFTLNTFSKRYGEVGDREFRQELHAFMSEIEAGEKVNHMGRAFTSRLTRLRAQVKVRAEIKESLRLAKAEGA